MKSNFMKIREIVKSYAVDNLIGEIGTLGDLTQNFPTLLNSNTKFELLYERRPKVNIHVKYSAK